jgi:DNA-binding MarR family transcriptional regulator
LATNKEPKLDEAFEFLRNVWAFDHALQARSKAMARTLGVTAPQRLAIRIIAQNPGISSGELARLLHLHPSTLTGVLQRLEARGELERVKDKGDGRRVLLTLTRAGQKLAQPTALSVEAAVRKVLSRTTRAQVDTMATLLSQLTDALGARN